MITVNRFAVQIKLLPLLQNKIQVIRLVLEEPEIFLETNTEGLGNWAFTPAEESPPASQDNSPHLPIVHDLLITGARLTYLNGETGAKKTFHLEHLNAHTPGLHDPLDIEITARHKVR